MISENKRMDISVIIPIYNVEEYLSECLDSVLNQTKDHIEVIMIDDGSTDSSGEIAREYASKYEDWHYYYIENGGLGHARNYGVPKATGKYIIFLDSDDVVTEDAYEKMFDLAEKNNSEFAICNVARFNSQDSWPSNLHRKFFEKMDVNAQITKDLELIYDTTSWNKLILRSFWLENGFQFPENILYEDIPVTIPMHYRAKNVSVVNSVGYLWRVREGNSKSITQSTTDLKNLQDRIAILKMLDKFFEENVVEQDLIEIKQLKCLEVDLMIFVSLFDKVPVEQARQMMRLIRDYIEVSVDPSIFEKTTLLNRQKYEYLMRDDLEGLISVLEYQKTGYYSAFIKEKDGEFFIDLPDKLFTIKDRNITKELAGYRPKNYLDDLIVGKEKIEIFTHLYKSRVNIEDFSQQKINAYLYNDKSNRKLPLPVEAAAIRNFTDQKGIIMNSDTGEAAKYNYDGIGFKITLNTGDYKVCSELEGTNRILLEYENRYDHGKIFLHGVTNSAKRRLQDKSLLGGNTKFQLSFSALDELEIVIRDEDNFVKSIFVENGNIHCSLEKEADAIWAEAEDGEQIVFETENHIDFYVQAELFDNGADYPILLRHKDGSEGSLLSRKKVIKNEDAGCKALIIVSAKTYCVKLCFRQYTTILNRMRIKGKYVALETITEGDIGDLCRTRKVRLCIDDEISERQVVLAKGFIRRKDGLKCYFLINFGNRKILKDLYRGSRKVYIEYEMEDGSSVRTQVYKERYINFEFPVEGANVKFYRCANGYVDIIVEQKWPEEENSPFKRAALTARNYPEYRKEPINPKRIVFESMWGGKYSCNPQHLYEYIDKYYPEYECIWILKDEKTPIKGNGIRVRRGSQKYYYYLATAKYLVNNVNFADDYVKREGQIEIQTMHGTPLKTLGLDVAADFPTEQSREKYIKKNKRWNYLIVQGEFMAEKAMPCYRFDGTILKTGYPRTDILFGNSQEDIDAIKKRLDLPLDKKILLYTPTWRVKNKFDMQLDLEKMREKLGDEYIILVRMHHLCAMGYQVPEDREFIYDFTNYRCVEDLYIISDILITDYSSVMFDYALLNKPMLFYTYDLEDYSENLRGLYVDFVEEAPGPMLLNTEEVISAIQNIEEEMMKYKEKVTKFHEKYLTYENGNSCAEIVRTVMGLE